MDHGKLKFKVEKTFPWDELTMSIDLAKKTLAFSKRGQTLGSPFSLSGLSEDEFQTLRPIAQLYSEGDTLEVLD